MPVTSEASAPYAPVSAILELMEKYRHRGLQKPFTPDVLQRAGVSVSLIPRTTQALQVLDLTTEDGMPTDTLEGLRMASESEFKARLEDWIRRAYAEVFQFVDPSKDDETAIRDAFRSYNPIGQQPRMVSLFIGLCEAAGIREGRKEGAPRISRPRIIPQYTKLQKPALKIRSEQASKRVQHSGQLPPAITGLLDSLPVNGEGWTQEQRDRFVKTFAVVLDFSFPIRESNDEVGDTEEA